jgi:hypothetical protein
MPAHEFKKGDIVRYFNRNSRADMVGSVGIVIGFDVRPEYPTVGIKWVTYCGKTYSSDTSGDYGWRAENLEKIGHMPEGWDHGAP